MLCPAFLISLDLPMEQKGLQDKGMRDLAVTVSSCKEIKSNRHCGKQLLATICGRGQTSDLPRATVHLVLSNIYNNFLNLSGIQGKETSQLYLVTLSGTTVIHVH